MSYIPRLKKEYKSNVVTRLIKEFSYDNVMHGKVIYESDLITSSGTTSC